MKLTAYTQILTLGYVMFLCCLTSARRNEAAQDDQIIQKTEGDQISRRDMLQLLGLKLQQNRRRGLAAQDLEDRSLPGYGTYQPDSRDVYNELQGDSEGVPTQKRQRPCFWSVITCY
jgi:hypothetical protein